jgi:transposase-like protein
MVSKVVVIKCPFCGNDKTSKNGHNKTGKQVYNCNNSEYKHRNFIKQYTHKTYLPEVREQVLKMNVNGNGTRATERILGISKDTVTAILKKHKNSLANKL